MSARLPNGVQLERRPGAGAVVFYRGNAVGSVRAEGRGWHASARLGRTRSDFETRRAALEWLVDKWLGRAA